MINEQDIRKFYQYLNHHPDEWTELRAIEWTPDHRGTVTQTWVNNIEDFTAFCRQWNGKRHVYAGVNPRSRKGGGRKEDITRVVGIPFDIDAQRAPGHEKDAATDAEIEEARRNQLNKLLNFIRQKGFNQPYVDFSGNGYRVIQRVDISIENHDEIAGKLELYFKEVKIEVPELDSIFDLPRIIKVPGTMSIKGHNTEERPHRVARIETLGSAEPDEKLAKHILSLQPQLEKPMPASQPRGGAHLEETLRKLEVALQNEDIAALYNGDWEKLGEGKKKWTRSEAEFTLIYRLFFYGITKDEIRRVMNNCKIGKWQQEGESYRRKTVKKAYKAYLSNPTRFFTKKSFVPSKLSEEITSEHRFAATSVKSPLYHYDPETGIWRPNGSEVIDQLVRVKLKHLWKSNYKNETEAHIRAGSYIDSKLLGGHKDYVVVENGLLNLKTRELTKFDPDLYELSRIPVKYDPNAKCPRIEKFLSEVLLPQHIDTFYELAGYCLYKDYPFAKFFIFHGGGNNGKSKALGLLSAFLGDENVSKLSLQSLTTEGFRTSEIHGKLANICGDIPSKPLGDTGLLKQITGGDAITLERKYHDPFATTCYAKLIFSANEIPDTRYDKTDAFYRRAILIPFPNKFDPEDPLTDPYILDKITTPSERSGLLNKALTGLSKLLQRGVFTGEKSTEERRIEYMREANPIQYFAEIYLEQDVDPDHFITNHEMYNYYIAVCRSINKTPKSPNVFSRELRRFATYADTGMATVGDSRVKVWRGVRVNWGKMDADAATDDTDATDVSLLLPLYNTTKNNTEFTLANNKKLSVASVASVADVTKKSHKDKSTPILQKRMNEVRSVLTRCREAGAEQISEITGIPVEGVTRLLQRLERDGVVFQPRPGVWRLV